MIVAFLNHISGHSPQVSKTACMILEKSENNKNHLPQLKTAFTKVSIEIRAFMLILW